MMYKDYIKIELIFSKIFIKVSNLIKILVMMSNTKSSLKEKRMMKENESCKSKR